VTFAVEQCFGAQHYSVSFEVDIPSGTSPQNLQPRPPNFFFNDFDILRIQTSLEIELRQISAMMNPSPQFMFQRLMRMLHNQGQINRQALVSYSESWQYFLTDRDRQAIVDLQEEEKEMSFKIQSRVGGVSDEDVRRFYLRYRASFDEWKKKASEKMWEDYRSKTKNMGHTWKLLKRVRGTSRAVPIEPGKLLEHFKNIFFDPNRPLSIQYPSLHHEPVFGPFLAADYELSDKFSEDELKQAMDTLNKEAGVGPGRVSAKWLLRIFSTDGSREYLLFFLNQCFLWGVCPNEWAHSELFVIYKGKGDITDPSNYRAINLLDEFYRLYSRILYKRLTSWAARYNFFSPAQYGFRPNSGTLEAALTLQTIVRSWHLRFGQPVYCVFIDIKKAFPSVDRVELINLLHRLGLPGPMVKALASTFALNTCTLKIEGFLSDLFPVNLGVREGDIDSPPMFNLVYGEILRNCELDLLNGDVFREGLHRVVGIAYADDLANLGLRTSLVQQQLFRIAESMLPFNLRINAGKTVQLIFLPSRRSIPVDEIFEWEPLYIEEEWIVDEQAFKYLGIHLDISVGTQEHVRICSTRARQAAAQIGRLCRQLEITNFSRLRTFFFSFVVSQFHGTQIVFFPEEDYEQALMTFFRACFSLPVGYPRAIMYYFAGSLEFYAQQIVARLRFFQKHARSVGFMNAIFLEDRRLFLLNHICWNSEFEQLFETFLPNQSFSELDLFDPQDEFREMLERESSVRRDLRLSLMPSGVLFRDLVPYQSMSSFLRELSRRSFEETRLVLIFFCEYVPVLFLYPNDGKLSALFPSS
jgi:hypothetical protein